MKNRIYFKNIVVSAEDLPKINQLVRLLSELSPSDAFIAVEFHKTDDSFTGSIKLTSPSQIFSEEVEGKKLLNMMQELSNLTMVHIDDWKANRFKEPLIS
jgi:hypothetical protein